VLSSIVSHECDTPFGGQFIANCKGKNGIWRKNNEMSVDCEFVDITDEFPQD
jgi:hypothetical protein